MGPLVLKISQGYSGELGRVGLAVMELNDNAKIESCLFFFFLSKEITGSDFVWQPLSSE